MIKRVIRNLQKKPKHVRDGVALSVASMITLLIFVFWLYNLPARNAAVELKQSEAQREGSGFSDIFGELGEQVAGLKESFSDVEVESTSTISKQVELKKTPPEEPLFNFYQADSASSTSQSPDPNETSDYKPKTPINIITTQATSTATSTLQAN